MDCSPPGFSSHGISQERILEWVAISFSTGSSWPRDRTWISRMAGRRFTFWATSGMSLERLRFGSRSRACCRERNSTSRWNAREPPGRSVSKLAPSPHNTPRPRDLGCRGNAAIGEHETPRREAASKEMHPVDPGRGGAHAAQRRCVVLAHGAEWIVKWQPWKYWERACVRIILCSYRVESLHRTLKSGSHTKVE